MNNKWVAAVVTGAALIAPLPSFAHTDLSIGIGLGLPGPVYYAPPPPPVVEYAPPPAYYVSPPVVYGPRVIYRGWYGDPGWRHHWAHERREHWRHHRDWDDDR